jgi:hypothetical protein
MSDDDRLETELNDEVSPGEREQHLHQQKMRML